MLKKTFLYILSVFVFAMLGILSVNAATSKELDIKVTMSDGRNSMELTDGSYMTYMTVRAGDSVTVSSNEPIRYVYVKWYNVPKEYNVSYDGKNMTAGKDGFLHELVDLGTTTFSVTFNMNENNPICEIEAYSDGEIPENVQVWKPHCEKADFLVFSSHADDEILFLGGVLAKYAGEENLAVQVVYFSDYTNGTKIREHEKLDGLWKIGVKYYPENGGFDDLYAETLDNALNIFNYDEALGWVVKMIRKYKPLVVVTQDINGEYGHGTHRMIAKAVTDAVAISNDELKYKDSAETYGAYDVPKTYLHLWSENKIKLDTRAPLANFGGKSCLDVAAEAYKEHVSQQWCWFYVSDTYEYSIADFGLYRTNVGQDTGNDMLENVVTYEEQARIEEEMEAQRLEALRLEKERESQSIAESVKAQESLAAKAQSENNKKDDDRTGKIFLGVAIACCIVMGFSLVVYARSFSSKKRRKHRR